MLCCLRLLDDEDDDDMEDVDDDEGKISAEDADVRDDADMVSR